MLKEHINQNCPKSGGCIRDIPGYKLNEDKEVVQVQVFKGGTTYLFFMLIHKIMVTVTDFMLCHHQKGGKIL